MIKPTEFPVSLKDSLPRKAGVFKFPVSDDPDELSKIQRRAILYHLGEGLSVYRRVFGSFPEDLETYLNSGLPIHWPRNVYSGSPVYISNTSLNRDATDFGKVHYIKIDSNNAQLMHVAYDMDAHEQTGEPVYHVRTNNLSFRLFDEYRDETHEDRLSAARAGWLANIRGNGIDVMGGTIPVNSASKEDERHIYGSCGQIADHIVREASAHYSFPNHRFALPENFSDLYDSSVLIIADNYTRLADMLASNNADFKIGFDHARHAHYAWLSVADTAYIAFCRVYFEAPSPETYDISHQYLGHSSYVDDAGNLIDDNPDFAGFKSMADMSSPVIDGNTLKQIAIRSPLRRKSSRQLTGLSRGINALKLV